MIICMLNCQTLVWGVWIFGRKGSNKVPLVMVPTAWDKLKLLYGRVHLHTYWQRVSHRVPTYIRAGDLNCMPPFSQYIPFSSSDHADSCSSTPTSIYCCFRLGKFRDESQGNMMASACRLNW